MSSVKKPPLPSGSIIGKRPDLYCLNWKQTQKKCEEFERQQDMEYANALKKFEEQLKAWKASN